MAEVTKKKIATIYSLFAGMLLSLFSGNARAASFWDFFKPATNTNTTNTRTSIVPTVGVMTAPAPTSKTSYTTMPTTGVMTAPAPEMNSLQTAPSTGVMTAPAPEATQVLNADLITISNIEDTSLRGFISQKALDQGKDPNQLSVQDFNTLRTDYLQMQVKILEEKLNELNEQNLSH